MRKLMPLLLLSLFVLSACHQSFYGPQYIMKPRNDLSIMEEVKRLIVQDKRINAKNVLVSCVQGTVILTGTVHSIKESDRAADVASQVPGVQFVQNEIIIKK